MKLPRLRIAHRLGIAIVLTISASFLLDQYLRHLLPPPPFLFVERDWLIETVAEAKRTAEAQGAAARFDRLPGAAELTFTMAPAAPADDETGEPDLGADLRQRIVRRLGVPPTDIVVGSAIFDQNRIEQTVRPATLLITRLPTLLTAETAETSGTIVLADLIIAVRLDNGRWLTIAPRNTHGSGFHYLRIVLGFGGSLFFIVAFSLWIGGSVVRPLTRLADAAERLGREREPTIITGMRSPEFTTIADRFNEMQLRLKRFLDERVQMLAAISHDLRTPLTRLRLLAEYLPDPGQRSQLLRNIADIEAMLGETLAFMSDEAHREPVAPLDIASLLITVTDDFTDGGAAVHYAGPDHLSILARPQAIRRALVNLIDNGCKYGGEVWVTLRRDDAALLIDIADAGAGIPDGEIERAFAPFERLEGSRSRETGGTGLGLTIARDVILQHDGTIVPVRVDQRFAFRVQLPVAG